MEAWRQSLYTRNGVFTPPVVLALFMLIQVFTFIDRGAINGALLSIREDKQIAGDGESVLTNAEAALLPSIFMVGFTFAAPAATAFGDKMSSRGIILIGLVSWLIGLILTGISSSYGLLVFARVIDGVGEGVVSSYMITIIENIAPPDRKVFWLAGYQAQIPLGIAIGVVLGGVMGKADVGAIAGWRALFYFVAIPGAICTVLLAFLPDDYEVHEKKKVEEDDDGSGGDKKSFVNAVPESVTRSDVYLELQDKKVIDENNVVVQKDQEQEQEQEEPCSPKTPHVHAKTAVPLLLCNLDFMLLSIAVSGYDFVLSAASSFLVIMIRQGLDVSTTAASLSVGIALSISGLIGTIIGGKAADAVGAGSEGSHGVYKASALCAVFVAAAIPLSVGAVLSKTLWLVMLLFCPACFLLVAIHAPVTQALLSVVPRNLRTYSMGFSLLIYHALGDAPAPAVVGGLASVFSGRCGEAKNWSTCLLLPVVNITNNITSNAGTNNNNNNNNSSSSWLPPEGLLSADGCKWMHAEREGQDSYCCSTTELVYSFLLSFLCLPGVVGCLVVVAVRQRKRWMMTLNPTKGEGGDVGGCGGGDGVGSSGDATGTTDVMEQGLLEQS